MEGALFNFFDGTNPGLMEMEVSIIGIGFRGFRF